MAAGPAVVGASSRLTNGDTNFEKPRAPALLRAALFARYLCFCHCEAENCRSEFGLVLCKGLGLEMCAHCITPVLRKDFHFEIYVSFEAATGQPGPV